ncbi:MAG TPA: NAD-dependent epimerase/dehydratase family protein [Aeromicrobium sp.]|nr:NAD-dependent epimerase/dehydratase family protein [Aeromicrobium sp.]
MEKTGSPSDRLWVVTGAEGFLGNNLVRELLARGERVRALTHAVGPHESLTGLACEVQQADVTDESALVRAFTAEPGGQVIVVHCAGIVSIRNKVSVEVKRVNVGGTQNVITACEQADTTRLVYVSSVHALKEPNPSATITEADSAADFDPAAVIGEYAKTKTEATALVLAATGLDRVVVHPSGLIGPHDYGDSHLTRLIRDAANGNLTAVVGGGYDFVDARDVANGIIAAAHAAPTGRTYLLTGHYAKVEDLVEMVAKLTGRKRRFNVLPLWFARLSAPMAELFYRIRGTRPLYTRYSLHTLTAPADFSHARASAELGYLPRPLDETLADTVAWLGL